MNKQKLLRVVNPLIALLLLNQAVSGMLHDVLPHKLFGLLHAGGWPLVGLAVIHVYLNWGWVKMNLLPRPAGKPN